MLENIQLKSKDVFTNQRECSGLSGPYSHNWQYRLESSELRCDPSLRFIYDATERRDPTLFFVSDAATKLKNDDSFCFRSAGADIDVISHLWPNGSYNDLTFNHVQSCRFNSSVIWNKYPVEKVSLTSLLKKQQHNYNSWLEAEVESDISYLSRVNYNGAEVIRNANEVLASQVYNTDILYNDLDTLFGTNVKSTLRRVRKYLEISEETNIDNFFEQVANFTPFCTSDVYGDFNFLHDVQHLINQKEFIKSQLGLLKLHRFLRSEVQKCGLHDQEQKSSCSPIILHLREYLNNIFNIKKYTLLLFKKVRGINNFNIKELWIFNIKQICYAC